MSPLSLLRDAAARRAAMQQYAGAVQRHDALMDAYADEDMVLSVAIHDYNLRLAGRAWMAERDDPEPPPCD